MKIITAVLCLVVPTSLTAIAEPALLSASQAKTGTSKKLEREILKAESRLGKAIAKRDVKALDKMLTDYYAESYEGSERASTKKTALDRCRGGTLEFYRIDSERTITSSADKVTVEGVAASRLQPQSGV